MQVTPSLQWKASSVGKYFIRSQEYDKARHYFDRSDISHMLSSPQSKIEHISEEIFIATLPSINIFRNQLTPVLTYNIKRLPLENRFLLICKDLEILCPDASLQKDINDCFSFYASTDLSYGYSQRDGTHNFDGSNEHELVNMLSAECYLQVDISLPVTPNAFVSRITHSSGCYLLQNYLSSIVPASLKLIGDDLSSWKDDSHIQSYS